MVNDMTEPSQNNALLDELVTFIQNAVPGFADGEYRLKVSQKVEDSQGNPISDDSLTNTYKFAVLGDRFRLSQPSQSVYTVFPADNASGKYSTVLPHVVFTKPTFPWTRYPTTSDPSAAGGADVPTWLTVLLFDEDDVAAYPSLQLAPANATMGDLFPPDACAESTLGDNYSYFHGDKDTTQLEPGQAVDDEIQILDVPLKLFWSVAPTIADLCLMAHVRQVSLVPKPTMPGVSDVGEPLGKFSLVFGNRLPQTQKKTYAYLVSLEELEPILPSDENGGPPKGFSSDDTRFLRLAVLKSWTFFSTGQSATFVDQVLELNGRPADSKTDAANTNLRRDYSGDNQVVKDALSMGYVPMNNDLRTGGKTVSWYRGPLLPYSITKPGLDFPIRSADRALAFDPTTGMLDVSYAVAWTIGRMIALQDKAFSTPFYNWKKGLAQKVVNSVEQDVMQEMFAAVLAASGPAGARAELAQASPSKALIHKMIHSL
jgi:hypothetical protein